MNRTEREESYWIQRINQEDDKQNEKDSVTNAIACYDNQRIDAWLRAEASACPYPGARTSSSASPGSRSGARTSSHACASAKTSPGTHSGTSPTSPGAQVCRPVPDRCWRYSE